MTLRSRIGRLAALLVLVAAPLGVATSTAAAEEQPSILKAYGLDWIERVKDEAWPQPKAQRPVICLLDTGVNDTPDTPADNPDGPIVARLAVDGGTGIAQGTTFQHLHGTQMASVIAAPRNNYGTVGVFPQARIVSVRVTQGDAVYITPVDMDAGVRACRLWALTHGGVAIASVVMPESEWDQRPSDVEAWNKVGRVVTQAGGLFVAAAGNADNAEVVGPLASNETVTVGAGDDSGVRCSFANAKQELGLLGPGCSKVGRWPSGSSAATAAVGAVAGALATRLPSMPVEQRRNLILSATDHVEGRLVFAGAKLASQFPGQIAAEASAVPTLPTELTISSEKDSSPSPAVRLWKPRAIVKWRRGWLSVQRTDRRRAGVLRVRLDGQPSSKALRLVGRRARVRLAARPRRAELWVESAARPPSWRSLATRVRLGS